MNEDMIAVLVGSIHEILLVVALLRLIMDKVKWEKKIKNNLEKEKQIDNVPVSILGFLEMNSADRVWQKVGSMVIGDILESYSNRDISLTEAQKKLVEEGFPYDETFDIIQDYIKYLDENDEKEEKEISEAKDKYNLILKITNKRKRVEIDDIVKETGINKNDITILIEEFYDIGIVKKIKRGKGKRYIIFS
jgi:hypothetical protein